MREHYSVESGSAAAPYALATPSAAHAADREMPQLSDRSARSTLTGARTEVSGSASLSPRARSILQLQRTHGNRYVQRALALNRQADGTGEVAADVESSIERSRGGGHTMDASVQTQMESAFGTDFNGVRIHTGAEAHSLNRAVNAVAFTTGQDIFFRDGAYDPGTSHGKELLAHELTHVVQQSGTQGTVSPAHGAPIERMCSHCEEEQKKLHTKLVVGEPDSQYEREAEDVSRNVSAFLNQASNESSFGLPHDDTSEGVQSAREDIAQGASSIELVPERPFKEHASDASGASHTTASDMVHIGEAVTTRDGVSRRISLRDRPDAWMSRKMNWKDTACKAACWAAGGAIAALISVACAAGTTFTLGGLAIPCTAVILAAAGAAGAGASVCGDICDNALATPANQTSSAQSAGDPTPDNAVTTADGTPVPVPDSVPEEATA